MVLLGLLSVAALAVCLVIAPTNQRSVQQAALLQQSKPTADDSKAKAQEVFGTPDPEEVEFVALTMAPTKAPTKTPTIPTESPTKTPTGPTLAPTMKPTRRPSQAPVTTPLLDAISLDNGEMVGILVANGADVNLGNCY